MIWVLFSRWLFGQAPCIKSPAKGANFATTGIFKPNGLQLDTLSPALHPLYVLVLPNAMGAG